MDQFVVSKTLDHISDNLKMLSREIPHEVNNIRKITLRLDRVANILEEEQGVSDRVSKIEQELENLDIDFTVAPSSWGRKTTNLYVYKGQLGQSNEASVLGRIVQKHGAILENEQRVYKIIVPHVTSPRGGAD